MEERKPTPDPSPNRKKDGKDGKDGKDRDNEPTSGLKTFARYSSMGFQMVVVILLFFWAGTKLDARTGTEKPVYTIVLTLLGVFAGLYIALKDFIGDKND